MRVWCYWVAMLFAVCVLGLGLGYAMAQTDVYGYPPPDTGYGNVWWSSTPEYDAAMQGDQSTHHAPIPYSTLYTTRAQAAQAAPATTPMSSGGGAATAILATTPAPAAAPTAAAPATPLYFPPTPFRPSAASLSAPPSDYVPPARAAGTSPAAVTGTGAFSSEGSAAPPRRLILDPAVWAADLTIDTRPHIVDWSVDPIWINATSCAVQEGCVQPGLRQLLRFNTRINNIGNDDFFVGDPYQDVNQTFFHYNPCHRHFHWPRVLDCSLTDASGKLVTRGMKIGFCLEDFFPASFPLPPLGKDRYDCVHQGISAGWADQYHKNLDCQWIDVTDVPAGSYFLNIDVNHDRIFPELNYDNNRVSIPVTVGLPIAPTGVAINDLCGGAVPVGFNQHYVVNTKDATSEGMKCAGIPEPLSSVWFKVNGTGQRLLASTCNPDTTVDTTIMIFRDCTPEGGQSCGLGSAVCVDGNDDDQCGAAAYTDWCSEAGVQYFIVVGGVGAAYGTVDLTVLIVGDEYESLYFAAPPANASESCSGPYINCPAALISSLRAPLSSASAIQSSSSSSLASPAVAVYSTGNGVGSGVSHDVPTSPALAASGSGSSMAVPVAQCPSSTAAPTVVNINFADIFRSAGRN